MAKSLAHTLAVVTGAGSGLGRSLALELCARGLSVAGFGRRADALQGTAALAPEGLFHALPLDVSDAAAVANAFAHLEQTVAPVTLLINNAAVYPRRDFLDETPDSFMHSVTINLGGVVNCTHAALAQMARSGRGRILNVSTFADIAPLPASAAYATSKGAARIFTRALVADLADRFPHIVVNDWMPGMLATEMGISGGLDPATAAKWGVTLALWQDPSLTGTVFEMDTEVLPPRSFKRKLKDRLLLRKPPRARRITA